MALPEGTASAAEEELANASIAVEERVNASIACTSVWAPWNEGIAVEERPFRAA